MIAVIADDFTGAAELAGIALQYNLSLMICTDDIVFNHEDVLIVSTDSRSLSKADAIRVTQKAISDLLKLKPTFIFKKVDSVLRGYVLDELKVQMELTGLNKTLLLPANPSLGRKIINQLYFINDVPIHQTSFVNDPEFSIANSFINAILKSDKENDLYVLKFNQELPEKGIIVGEVSSNSDINHWMDRIDDGFLLAGAGDFFNQLLERKLKRQLVIDLPILSKPHLYVSGTSFKKSENLIQQIKQQSNCVQYLSIAIMQQKQDLNWFKEVSNNILKHQKLVIAIDEISRKSIDISALALRTAMAKAVKYVIEKEGISELLIEGGSTAAAIFQELGLSKFIPLFELSRGVIKMKSTEMDLYITVKPGSYELPEEIKKLYLDSF